MPTKRESANYAIGGAGADDINLVNGTNFILGDQGQISVSGTNRVRDRVCMSCSTSKRVKISNRQMPVTLGQVGCYGE